MLHYTIIIPILLSIFFSLVFLAKCADGCDFNSICSSGVCVDETLAQHLSEKVLFNVSVANLQNFLILFTIVLCLFLSKCLLLASDQFESQIKAKYRQYRLAKLKWIDYLIILFSDGILNAKIY